MQHVWCMDMQLILSVVEPETESLDLHIFAMHIFVLSIVYMMIAALMMRHLQ